MGGSYVNQMGWLLLGLLAVGLIASSFLGEDDTGTPAIEASGGEAEGGASDATPTQTQSEGLDELEVPAMIGGVVLEPEVLHKTDTVRAVVTTAPGFDLRYEWEVNGRSDGLRISNSFAGPYERGDSIRVIVTPYKAGVAGIPMASNPVQVANSAPRYAGGVGQGFSLDGHTFNVSDPDGDDIRFSLSGGPPGLSIDPVTGKLAFPPQPGGGGEPTTYDTTVLAVDGHGGEVKIAFPVTIR